MQIIDAYKAPSLSTAEHRKKDYEGVVTKSWFEIIKINSRAISSNPVITGEILPQTAFTNIKVKMKMERPAIIFLLIWFGVIGIFVIFMGIEIVRAVKNNHFQDLGFGHAVPFVMLIFGYIITYGPCLSESTESKDLLVELFEAEYQ